VCTWLWLWGVRRMEWERTWRRGCSFRPCLALRVRVRRCVRQVDGERVGPGGWVGNPRRLLRRGAAGWGGQDKLLSSTYYIVGTRSQRGRLRYVRGPRSSCLCVRCVGIGAMSSMGLSWSQRWNREPHRRRVRRMSQVDGKVARGPAGFAYACCGEGRGVRVWYDRQICNGPRYHTRCTCTGWVEVHELYCERYRTGEMSMPSWQPI
jgi:hypothetical protein